jgi:hypothetical protein
MSLPSTLAFGPKRDAVNSTLFNQISIPLNGSTINPLDTVTIPVQGTGRYGAYLDPSMTFLSFQISNPDATQSIVIDNSAYSFIERVVVQSSGSVISDLQNFGAWAAMLLDMSPQSSRSTGFAITAGCEGGTGQNPNFSRKGATITAGSSLNVSIPLIGTAIDCTGTPDKLIPIGAMSDLQIILYMSSARNAVTAGTAPTATWQLRNFRLNTTFVQLDETAQRMIDEANGGAFKFSSTLWRAFNSTTGATDGGNNVVVPVKSSSIKSTYSIWRPVAANESYSACWQSARHNPFGLVSATTLGSAYAQVGALSIPNIPLRTAPEFFSSLQNAWHQLAVPSAYDTQLTVGDFDAAASTTSQAPTGSFVLGLNMESFSGKTGVFHSGVNCTGGTSFVLNAVYPAALSAAQQITTFVQYDAIIEVAGGSVVCSW